MKYQDIINQIYFANEFSGRKYLKQHIVMSLYNKQLRKWKECTASIIGYNEPKPTLKEVWKAVNFYFNIEEPIESEMFGDANYIPKKATIILI